jgi:hypothetical protein
MKGDTIDQICLPACWVDGDLFEKTMRNSPDTLSSKNSKTCFHFPIGCKIMVDAGVKMLSLANQLRHLGKRVALDFEEEESGTLGYLNRMGFIDSLHPGIEVLPQRPYFSGAELYRGENPSLVEFESINPDHQDRALPNRLTKVLVKALRRRDDCESLGNATYTVFAELIDNIYEHSSTELDGFAVLQVYRNGGRVKVCVSDSGKGIIKTLRPVLKLQRSEYSLLSDTDLIVEAFRSGLSRHGAGRGCGLKACADQAVRFHANLAVRLRRCFVRLFPSADGYCRNTAVIYDSLPLLHGTHISFDF